MTLEAAIYAGGVILVCCVIWQTQRSNNRRLTAIECELSGLRDIVSRLFLMSINERDGEIAAPKVSTPEVSPEPVEAATSCKPVRGIESDLIEVDGLCAKLITLAPPKEARPLTSQPGPDESKGAAH
jgi:hypothetical protein